MSSDDQCGSHTRCLLRANTTGRQPTRRPPGSSTKATIIPRSHSERYLDHLQLLKQYLTAERVYKHQTRIGLDNISWQLSSLPTSHYYQLSTWCAADIGVLIIPGNLEFPESQASGSQASVFRFRYSHTFHIIFFILRCFSKACASKRNHRLLESVYNLTQLLFAVHFFGVKYK